MKMMTERVPQVVGPVISIADLKLYLRVDAQDDDFLLFSLAQTAAAEVEHFAQVALRAQTIRVTVTDPPQIEGMSLPIGPVLQDATITVTADDQPLSGAQILAGIRPLIFMPDAYLAMKPRRLAFEYEAGFGNPANIPADLVQAIMDQAALLYDGRSPMDAKALAMSPHMARIAARYRGVSL